MITPERVKQINSEESLFDFLRDEMNWPLPEELATYDFYADELGLST